MDQQMNPVLIAIIGLSCRFPGDAVNPSEFWELLKNGKDAFSSSSDRYNAEAFYHPKGSGNRQNTIPRGAHFLKQDPYVFDAAFFNITAAEAMALDPKQRIALEVAVEALENSGLPLQKVAGTQTSCFMGSAMSDYREAVGRDFGNYPKYHLLGTSEEMVANRISHFLDIHGPSATIMTACSSSLVATHLACQSIQTGEADMAIAGGVGVILSPESTMHLNNLGFLNPEGHSKSFDDQAGGYGRGEGCGVLVLKRLDQAVRDGNNIRAVIRASGVNSDGWTQGVTMPSGDAQAALIRRVYESAGLDYGSTQYVEAHGTGTKAGDPIETGAIYRTIGLGDGPGRSSRKKLWIGSVKPNIGHLEAAAGVASLIKGVLAMENGFIPPNIHFHRLNPAIPLEEWNMAVPTKLTPWPVCQTKRMSVSGFGMGGTNAHLVLESFNGESSSNGPRVFAAPTGTKRLFVFSSHDRAGFKRLSNMLIEHLDRLGPAAASPQYLADLAYTLVSARSGLTWKDTVFAESVAELRGQLETVLGENATRTSSGRPRLGFVFTGQGAQWARMGIEMLDRPVFSRSVAKSAAFLKEMGCDWDPVAELQKAPKESRLGEPERSQPICSVLQIALVEELRSWGVVPSKVIGHSSGEIAAAYAIGALSHRDAIAVAYFRGRASAGLSSRKGGMMAVGCSREDAQKLMAETKIQLTVACVNSPSNVTISGDVDTLELLRAVCEKRGLFARRLKVEVAYHSPHMNSCSAEYVNSIADISPLLSEEEEDQEQGRASEKPIMVSSVTGSEVDAEALGPYYWVRNLISPVLFTDAVKEMVCPEAEEDGKNTIDFLVEIGPHGALGGPIEQILSHHGIKNVGYRSMLTRGESALNTSLSLAAELFRIGVPLDVVNVNGDSQCRLLTSLPPYPWNHSEKFRADSRMHRELVAQKVPTQSLIGAPLPRMDETEQIWRGFVRLNDESWLRGHTVGTTVLFPAAGMISMALETAKQMADPGRTTRAFRLRDVSFIAAMALSDDAATEVTVHMRPHLVATKGSTPASWWEFTVSSCSGTAGQLRNNCRGLITIDYEEKRSAQLAREDASSEAASIADYHRILLECREVCSRGSFYDRVAKSAFRYEGAFQGVRKCHPGVGKTAFEVELADIGETFTSGKLDRPFLIDAATLDAIFQGYLGSTAKSPTGLDFGLDKTLLPSAVAELEISATIPGEPGYIMPGICRSRSHGFNERSADITMFDHNLSKVLVSITDFRLSEVEMDDSGNLEREEVDPADITSVVRWEYALDLLEPSEISKVVRIASPGTIDEGLIKVSTVPTHHCTVSSTRPTETWADMNTSQLVCMVVHQNPAANVIELVANPTGLRSATMSKLPPGTILPAQVRYGLVRGGPDEDGSDSVDDAVFGQRFVLGASQEGEPAGAAPADLLVIPHTAIAGLETDLGSVLEHLLSLAKPGARVLIAEDATHGSQIAKMTAKGLDLLLHIPGEAGRLGLYSVSTEKHTNGVTSNGIHKNEAVILERPASSAKAKAFAEELQSVLADQGYSVSTLRWTETVGVSGFERKTYISLLELEQPFLQDLSEPDFQNIRKLTLDCERLLWITRGDNPSFGMSDGFLRVIRGEIAGAMFQVLHLSEGTQNDPTLAARVLGTTEDSEFREDNGLLQVSRIYKSTTESSHVRDHLYDSTRVMRLPSEQGESDAPLCLTIGKPGLLDTLHFAPDEEARSVPLGDYEVEIQVKATGVNFKDVMGSMGLVPVRGLGQEASGVVLRAGQEAAKAFKPGDRVSTLTLGGTHATITRCDCRVTELVPDHMSFEEAAAVPVVYATAYYALIGLARLSRGQSVLIHAAAGGVGQAAVQLANYMGLVVYATVGTEDKRKLIMEEYGVPAEHIFNSRDTSFAKGIKRMTNGRGVDCVLNSLSGELLRVSFDCLATFGTFVEIGLRDITDNMRLDMRPFRKSTTFTFCDLHTLLEEDPAMAGKMLSAACKLVHEGVLHPPRPMTIYPVGQVEDVFRSMQQGKHRGKMVLSFTQNQGRAPVLHKAKDSLKLDPQATYLFVGGLGGLGRSLAMEMVASGARNIAFISRSGDSKPEATTTVNNLKALGARVKVYRADVGDEASFLAAMALCSEQLPPIKGVIHMAMVLVDIVFEKMSYKQWLAPIRPKVDGTWNLHKYFGPERPLDFMIFCSSTAGVCGNPSQANYAAGNTYQDELARYRRAQGLKAVAVNLGIMRDVGVLAEQGTHSLKVWEEVLGIREPAFHALMKSLINGQQGKRGPNGADCPVQVCVGLGTGDLLAANGLASPHYFQDPRFGPLAVTSTQSASGAGRGAAGASLAARLVEAGGSNDQAAAASIIADALVHKTAEILRIPPGEIDPSLPLYHYGVDSLVALEVRNWITREIKANIALLEILAAVPMEKFAMSIAQKSKLVMGADT